MTVGFANAVHIALRLPAVAGAADLHAASQFLLPLHVVKHFTFRLPVSDESGQLFRGDRLAQRDAPQRGQTLKVGVRLPPHTWQICPSAPQPAPRRLVEKLRVKRDVAAGARQRLPAPAAAPAGLGSAHRTPGRCWQNGDGAVSRFRQQRRVLLEELFRAAKMGG